MKKTSKKGLVLLVALALLVGITAGSTLAWLLDTTDPVKNTFTTSNVDITLEESNYLNLQMIPGHTITKDPKVTVIANSEKCYVFVKVEKSANFDTYMTYDMADGWTALDGNAGVFYRTVDKSATNQSFAVIKNDTVNVKAEVTNADMATAKNNQPTLTVTAYACQYYKDNTASGNDTTGTPFTAAEAWGNMTSVETYGQTTTTPAP